jgi:hypothetical protein
VVFPGGLEWWGKETGFWRLSQKRDPCGSKDTQTREGQGQHWDCCSLPCSKWLWKTDGGW